MIKFDVLNRFDGSVKFTAEIACGENATRSRKLRLAVEWGLKNSADLRYANLSHANLSHADLSHADLRYADLRYADLRYADLRYANLRYANLSYADLRSVAAGNHREIKTIQDSTYAITYTNTHMAIGCQQHTIKQWFRFSKEQIAEMDCGALEWWTKSKPILKAIMEVEDE